MTDVVQVRLFAAAAEAAGVEEADVSAGTVGQLREVLVGEYGGPFARVLAQCAVLVGGVRAGDETVLEGGTTVDVLPPFAGG